MTVPPDEIARKVRQWVAHADEDMSMARHGLSLLDKCPYRLIAYHAQQCAEKHLKAYLVLRGTDFPYTHNIARLLELCTDQPDWGKKLRDAEQLTAFAITTRYPGEDEPVTEAEARNAVDIAARVRETVMAALAAKGIAV